MPIIFYGNDDDDEDSNQVLNVSVHHGKPGALRVVTVLQENQSLSSSGFIIIFKLVFISTFMAMRMYPPGRTTRSISGKAEG